MNNQKLFDLIFWIFILPVIICVKTPTVKFLIFSIGLIHAIYSAPWPPITLMLVYPITLIMISNGYKNRCYLSMLLGFIVFIGHYLKDSGLVDFYYIPDQVD